MILGGKFRVKVEVWRILIKCIGREGVLWMFSIRRVVKSFGRWF